MFAIFRYIQGHIFTFSNFNQKNILSILATAVSMDKMLEFRNTVEKPCRQYTISKIEQFRLMKDNTTNNTF